jgi:glycosyltransferase involved in cell wall biosynthesis
MKVLHIGYSDSGGAGKGMLNLHRALMQSGVDSHVLVAQKISFDDAVSCAPKNMNLGAYSKNRLVRFVQRVLRKMGWSRNILEKYSGLIKQIPATNSCYYTFPISYYDISQHPLVREADIIHLHWISDFVDFPSFFRRVDQGIVWTLRDENPGLGGFHYESDRNEYGEYYKSIEDDFLEIKRKSLSNCKNLTLVAMSDVMEAFCAHNEILKSFPVKRIDNLVDLSLFNSIDTSSAKKSLGLNEDAFVVLFVSVSLGDPRKNLAVLYDAVSRVPFAVTLVCVGKNDYFKEIPENVICLNSVNSERLMSIVYSAADVFITPSVQESFGKTTIEALSCGTPVISSVAGIAPEVITPDNGILLNEITVDAVTRAILKAKTVYYDRQAIRGRVVDRFDPSRIVREYKELYEKLLAKSSEDKTDC